MRHDIDIISERVLGLFPDMKIVQLSCSHPADDDGIWDFRREGVKEEVSLESSSYDLPFVVESTRNGERSTVTTIDEAVEAIRKFYSQS